MPNFEPWHHIPFHLSCAMRTHTLNVLCDHACVFTFGLRVTLPAGFHERYLGLEVEKLLGVESLWWFRGGSGLQDLGKCL